MPGLQLPGVGADPEGDRDGCERVRAVLKDPARLLRRLAADVDACDPDAVGESARGAREGQAENHCRQGGQHGKDHSPLPENAPLGARPAGVAVVEAGPGSICAEQARLEV